MQSENIINFVLRHIAPWVVGIALFWGVSNIFFAPSHEGKTLAQGDVAQYLGMSQDIREHRAAKGEDPQWTGNMFSGMPAYLIDVEYPTQDVKQTVGGVVKVVDDPHNMILFAMVLMMVAVVLMGVNPWIGIVAGLAYGLSTYFFLIIEAGHITKMWALVYAPPLVGAVWYALRRNMWVGSTLAALFGSLELGANHPQITYYFLLACGALWLSELYFAIREKGIKRFSQRTALLAVAALVALGSNFAPLWYAKQHQHYTTRGISEAVSDDEARDGRIAYNTQWSYGRAESFNMLVPNYMGESSMGLYEEELGALLAERSISDGIYNYEVGRVQSIYDKHYPGITREEVEYYLEDDVAQLYNMDVSAAAAKYWGKQPFTAGPTYLGAVVVFFAILGLILTSSRNRWWIVAVSLFALLLAWGSNIMGFYELMFDYLPAYSTFRTVSMALVVVQWSAPLLMAFALWRLWNTTLTLRQLAVRVVVALGVVVVMIIFMALVADYGRADIEAMFGNSWWSERIAERMAEARRAAFAADAWRTMFYVAMSASAVMLYGLLCRRGEGRMTKYAPYILTAVVGILATMDLVGVDSRYLDSAKWQDKPSVAMPMSAADREIMRDTELGYRVLDLSVSDPYQSARASYFHRSVGGYHGAKMGRYADVIARYLDNDDPEILAALNTRYVINGGEVLTLEEAFGLSPLGAAWFVDEVIECATPAEELEYIGIVDLATTAVVAEGTPVDAPGSAEGEIALMEYAPNRLKYEYRAADDVVAVFSEIYFADGWTAYIDGKQADYFAVDYILRGMSLPAGEHTVEWRFRAPRWDETTTIMGVASWAILLALAALAIVPLVRRIMRKRNNEKIA